MIRMFPLSQLFVIFFGQSLISASICFTFVPYRGPLDPAGMVLRLKPLQNAANLLLVNVDVFHCTTAEGFVSSGGSLKQPS